MGRNKDHLKAEVLERYETQKNKEQIARDLIKAHHLEDNVRSLARWIVNVINNRGLLEECERVGIPAENVGHYWHKSKHYSLHVKGEQVSPVDEFKEHAEAARKELSDSFQWTSTHTEQTGGNLLVPCIFDLHLGKLAWGEETGEDYDMGIAKQRFKNAISDLIHKTKSYAISRVLFPVGNDIYNSDKAFPFAQTTAGTPQMDDTRWQKLFREGPSLICWAVAELSKVAKVDVVTVFSNHDFERVFYLGEVLSAIYANHPDVTVNNNPKVRKYYQWGKCLLGTAHGHNEKPQDLPLIMAQEASQMWSDTWYREWLLGHLHHKYKLMTQESKDYRGVKVTYLTSPSAPDAWHHQKAYIGSIKGAEAFVYNSEEGFIGSAVHNIK